jgi:hypothetical protein
MNRLLGFCLLGCVALLFTFAECLVWGFSWRAWLRGLGVLLFAAALASAVFWGLFLLVHP